MKTDQFQHRNVSIIRLTVDDVMRRTDDLKTFFDLVSQNESMYPDIDKWLKEKVLPGIKNGSRVGFLATENEVPIATAVVKRGDKTKFCHLKISQPFQDDNLGNIFFILMAAEVRSWAKEIHFTLPESLWEKKKNFFESFGFDEAVPSSVQYRLFEQELSCSARFTDVWKNTLEKLAKMRSHFSVNNYSMAPSLLLSIRSNYAQKILSGEKTVEIRTRFSNRWTGQRVCIYASGTGGGLIGEATISGVEQGKPDEIWERYQSHIGCNPSEYRAYVADRKSVFAVALTSFIPYASRVPLTQIETLSKESLVPPQSYLELRAGTPWSKAISVAAILHARSTPNKRGEFVIG
jgi:predicted transcriptional regulator